MRVKFSTFFLAGFTATAALLLLAEIASFSATQKYPFRTAAPASPPAFMPAFSNRAIQSTLLACDRSMSPPNSEFQVASVLQATASECADFAARVILWSPTHGFAFFVAAQAANINGSKQIQDIYLTKSQNFAPFEGWLAQRRITLRTKQNITRITPANSQLDADISTLLTTQSGAELLATLYLHRPQIRAALAWAAGQAGSKDQTRFLNQLRQQQVIK